METFAFALSLAIPGFVVLILLEEIFAHFKGLRVNRAFDMISSLTSGMSFILKEILGLGIIIISYDWMVDHVALFDLKSSLLIYGVCFIGLDFAGYWSHRFNHEFNLLWNRHIIHHSSEEFNLSCALRQEISAFVAIYFFLYIPIALMGVPTEVIAIIAPIQLFAQFWYHTRLINKMGFLEYIIVTPSHHRVHHAINDIYIDKNYSQIFIVWDKLFGTFQPELENEPPVYGIKKPAKTWNPFIINFMHIWLLFKDAWHTRNWIDKLKIWMMPTGWRPEDVQAKYPIEITEDVYSRSNYDTPASSYLKGWSWFQLISNLGFMYYILMNIGSINFGQVLLISLYLIVSMFAYTSLMDRSALSILAEIVKMGFAVWISYQIIPTMFAESWILFVQILVLAHSALSLMMCLFFMKKEKIDQLSLV